LANFRLRLVVLAFLAIPSLAQQSHASSDKLPALQAGAVLPRVVSTKHPEQSYALYLP
jgi:hypothetical protein